MFWGTEVTGPVESIEEVEGVEVSRALRVRLCRLCVNVNPNSCRVQNFIWSLFCNEIQLGKLKGRNPPKEDRSLEGPARSLRSGSVALEGVYRFGNGQCGFPPGVGYKLGSEGDSLVTQDVREWCC